MPDETRSVSRRWVQTTLGVEEEFLLALEEEAIVVYEREGYAPAAVERIRVCHSLHAELGVNFPGLEVALQLLDTIHAERGQFRDVLSWLRTRLEESPTPSIDDDRKS